MSIENRTTKTAIAGWLPDLDLNQDKQIQSLLCYRYTIGQPEAKPSLDRFLAPSRPVESGTRSIAESARPLKRLAGAAARRLGPATIHRR